MTVFGGIYEHSPWITDQVWRQGLGESEGSVEGLAEAMRSVVDGSSAERKLTLIRAHPDLAGKAAVRGELTSESNSEQASAGIDQCNEEEFERFQKYNEAYWKKFDFPFVMAVRGSDRHLILKAFEQRVQNDNESEFAQALVEIHKIAKLRLQTVVEDCWVSEVEIMRNNKHVENLFTECVDLAQPRLGTHVVYATDEFFAAKERLIDPADPVFIPDKFDNHGKWMDGWESRRKRVPGHDYCVIKLGVPGLIKGFDINTSHFTGNYPPAASIDACISDEELPDEDSAWEEILPTVDLQGNSHHYHGIQRQIHYTHLRLNIYPDGGVARLRVYGLIRPDWSQFSTDQIIDLAALESGGQVVACSDEHYGSMHNLNAPGRGVNMGDGWETARRRGPGHDWAILKLGHAGAITKIEIDTAHFKGNYPDRVSVQAARVETDNAEEIVEESASWATLLPEVKLEMDRQQEFEEEIHDMGAVTHIRMNIFPDGGISRIRLFGTISL